MEELNENIKIHELTTICRCCLSSINQPLISFDQHTTEMFNFCIGLQVNIIRNNKSYHTDEYLFYFIKQIAVGDGFPSLICSRCSKNLSLCYDFRQKCLKASEILSSVVPLQFEPECRLDLIVSDNFITFNNI